VGQTSGHQFGDYQAGRNRLTQANPVRQEQAHTAHGERADDGNKLIRLDVEPARLAGQQRARAQSLLEEESLVIEQPLAQSAGAGWVHIVANGTHLLQAQQ
jgi:hypothetical protein